VDRVDAGGGARREQAGECAGDHEQHGGADRDPEVDLAQLARAQGALGFGPVTDSADLVGTFRQAVDAVAGGAVAVVDVRVAPGYAPAAVAGLFRG